MFNYSLIGASQVALVVKNLPPNARRCKKCGLDPWVGKIPWRREWHPTPVFSPGEPHGQRSLGGYSPWGRKEPDATERLNNKLVLQMLPDPHHSGCWRWTQERVVQRASLWSLFESIPRDLCPTPVLHISASSCGM